MTYPLAAVATADPAAAASMLLAAASVPLPADNSSFASEPAPAPGNNNKNNNKAARRAERKAAHKAALKAAQAVLTPAELSLTPIKKGMANRERGALVAALRASSSVPASPAASSCPGTPVVVLAKVLVTAASSTTASIASDNSAATTPTNKNKPGVSADEAKLLGRGAYEAAVRAQRQAGLNKATRQMQAKTRMAQAKSSKRRVASAKGGNSNNKNNATTNKTAKPANAAPAISPADAALLAALGSSSSSSSSSSRRVLMRAGSSGRVFSASSNNYTTTAQLQGRPSSCGPKFAPFSAVLAANTANAANANNAPAIAIASDLDSYFGPPLLVDDAILAAAKPFEVVPGLYRASGPGFLGVAATTAGVLFAAPLVLAAAAVVPASSKVAAAISSSSSFVASGALALAEAACAASATLGARCVARALMIGGDGNDNAKPSSSSLLGLAARGCKVAVGGTAVVAGLGGLAAAKAVRGLLFLGRGGGNKEASC